MDAKAMALMAPILGMEQSRRLVDLVWDLEKVEDIRQLIPLLIARR